MDFHKPLNAILYYSRTTLLTFHDSLHSASLFFFSLYMASRIVNAVACYQLQYPCVSQKFHRDKNISHKTRKLHSLFLNCLRIQNSTRTFNHSSNAASVSTKPTLIYAYVQADLIFVFELI